MWNYTCLLQCIPHDLTSLPPSYDKIRIMHTPSCSHLIHPQPHMCCQVSHREGLSNFFRLQHCWKSKMPWPLWTMWCSMGMTIIDRSRMILPVTLDTSLGVATAWCSSNFWRTWKEKNKIITHRLIACHCKVDILCSNFNCMNLKSITEKENLRKMISRIWIAVQILTSDHNPVSHQSNITIRWQ